MPFPSNSLATLRPDLAASFEEFAAEMDANGFVGYQVLPLVEVANKAGSYGVIPVKELLRNHSTSRAPGAMYSRTDWQFETKVYNCQEHGLEGVVDDITANMYRNYFDAEAVTARRLRYSVMAEAESRIASAVFNATTWSGGALTTAVSTEWSTVATAAPVSDVAAAKEAVFTSCGMYPNALIISRRVFHNLRRCAQVIDLCKSQGFMDVRQGSIGAQQLAQVFDLDRVIVAGSARNSAAEGGTVSIAPRWSGEYAMVARIATSNDFSEPCIGRSFYWSADGGDPMGTVEQYRDETRRGEVLRVRHDVAETIIYPQAGHLLSNITA